MTHDRQGRKLNAQQALPLRLKALFWAKVDVRGEQECWPWMNARAVNGYGVFGISAASNGGKPDQWKAHRLAWSLTHGEVPDELCICHTCDNRICCNPSHLFLGTADENVADKVAKGRQSKGDAHARRLINPPRGERNCKARLTELQVVAMRAAYASGTSRRALGSEFGVSGPTVYRVTSGRSWRHI